MAWIKYNGDNGEHKSSLILFLTRNRLDASKAGILNFDDLPSKDENCWVYIKEGDIIGYVSFSCNLIDRWAYIDNLLIDRGNRGERLGRWAIELAFNFYEFHNLNYTKLTVWKDNKDAIGFYSHLGFEQVGENELGELRPDGNYYPCIYMAKKMN